MHRTDPPPKKIFRYNQVEIVILITIVISILSYVIPIAYRSVHNGKLARCTANQKQLGIWIKQYCQANNGFFPAFEDGWIVRIAETGGLTVDPNSKPQNEFACPSQSFKSFTEGKSPEEYWRGSYYGINQHIASNLKNQYGEYFPEWIQANIQAFRYPSQKAVVADASGGNYWGMDDRDPTFAGISRDAINYAQSLPPAPAKPFPYLRHINATGNFLFADGHVEAKGSWPPFMKGIGTSGYYFWHGEHRRIIRKEEPK